MNYIPRFYRYPLRHKGNEIFVKASREELIARRNKALLSGSLSEAKMYNDLLKEDIFEIIIREQRE